MSAPQETNKCCSACGDHYFFANLKKGICPQCWGYSAIAHYVGVIKKLLKKGE